MKVEKWEVLEIVFQGKKDGNPFADYELTAEFSGEHESVTVRGFYDGAGIYKVRFMPSFEGIYHYKVAGNCFIDGGENPAHCGSFEVLPAKAENHGPVRAQDKRYLIYADKTPYHSIGTTCYAWLNQTTELQEQTLETLKNSSFNKIRFCVFPKYYQYNEKEPASYPYVRGKRKGIDEEKAANFFHMPFPRTKEPEDVRDFNCYQFNPEYFRNIDERVKQLAGLGIEADIILYHPYDKWDFACMTKECNELYLRYMIARYGAFHNVWWSMANEYDLFHWSVEEWDAYGTLVSREDPYHHLISIHNCMKFFDYRKEWITHCSMQRIDLYKHVEETEKHLEFYDKPVVWDEIAYEGNIDMGWGNISGQELVRRFWEATLRGGHGGHGETFVHPEDILWWSHGGVLHGESEPRFAFLKKLWDEVPGGQLKCGNGMWDEVVGIPAEEDKVADWGRQTWCSFELHYYGFTRPSYKVLLLPEDEAFQVDVIDTWNMTIEDAGIHHGQTKIELPGREWMGLRLRRVENWRKSRCR